MGSRRTECTLLSERVEEIVAVSAMSGQENPGEVPLILPPRRRLTKGVLKNDCCGERKKGEKAGLKEGRNQREGERQAS